MGEIIVYIILYVIIFVLLISIVYIYLKTRKILKNLDIAMDSALNNDFTESNFDESKLSKLESKMYKYLRSGSVAKNQINAEKNSIKTLVSDISHQTKTPIANILLYTQLLSETENLDDDTKQMIYQIENQTDKLNFLIKSLIKMSRLESDIVKVTPKTNSVIDLITNVTNQYYQLAKEKNIELVVQNTDDILAIFDFKWTNEALSNILDNAIKYTQVNGQVSVVIEAYEMFVRIDIKDNGIGIAEYETSKIFSRFYRSPKVANEKGVGIGLYLAREIVTKQDGYIKVSSQQGTTFSVFLPK